MDELKEKDDEIIRLKAELEKTHRKGQPARGGYAAPRTGDKDFDEMTLDEQEAHLRHMTAEADSWR
jgi:transposase